MSRMPAVLQGGTCVRSISLVHFPAAQELFDTLEPLVPSDAPSLRSRLRPVPSVLEGLLDLAGSVRLGERARACAAAETTPVEPLLATQVLEAEDEIRDRLRYLRRSAQARVEAVLHRDESAGEGSFLTTAAIVAILRETGLVGLPKRQAARHAEVLAAEITAPQRELLARVLRTVRGELHAIREEVSQLLQAAGGEVAMLETLDAALQRALALRVEKLHRRVGEAFQANTIRALTAAVEELSPTLGDDDLATAVDAWNAPDGFLGRQNQAVLGLVPYLVELELSRLEALGTAASELAIAGLAVARAGARSGTQSEPGSGEIGAVGQGGESNPFSTEDA